jgi:hypothetical protein
VTLRFTHLDQLAACSPAVRAQLEKHLGQPLAEPPAPVPLEPKNLLAEAHGSMKRKVGRPEQVAGELLVKWIDLIVLPNGLRPGQFFYHVANGGGRSKAEAGILKGQGVRAGQPDYNLDLPAGPYHGLRLELKAEDGAKPPDHQLEILARLESVGFKCVVAWGFNDACQHIDAYLDLIVRAAAAGGEARRAAPDGLPAHG